MPEVDARALSRLKVEGALRKVVYGRSGIQKDTKLYYADTLVIQRSTRRRLEVEFRSAYKDAPG